jgi:hypothetical protein
MILKYLYINRYYTIAISYFLLSIFLKIQGIVDITIPCIFNFLFNIHCPGCGFTRSFIELLNLDFEKSLEYNVLTIPIIVSMIYFIVSDFRDFRKQYKIDKNF